MVADAVLGLLGLARRANKLACGEDKVKEMAMSGKCRVICLASDAGDGVRRKAKLKNVPMLALPYDRQTLGNAVGLQRECAICAIDDIGMANALANKLAGINGNQQAAAEISSKKARIDARKGKKKKGTA